METDDPFTSDIVAALACLPFERDAEALRACVNQVIKHVPPQRLRHVIDRIAAELDADNPSVRRMVELIDGQLALREIGDGAFWR